MAGKLNVVFLVSGYPSPENPAHGIFNKRAAEAIKRFVTLHVIQFRILKPGRGFVKHIQEDGFKRTIISVPFIPFAESFFYYLNTKIFYWTTRIFAGKILASCNLIHAGDGNVAVLSTWFKRKLDVKVLGQFIGGDINSDLPAIKNKRWMRNFAKELDGVSFNSLETKNTFNRFFGACKNERVIYRGVNTEVFHPHSGKEVNAEIIFYFLGGVPNYRSDFGRNTKGGFLVMEAWSRLEKEFEHISLQFAGPDGNIEMMEKWRNDLKFPQKVTLSPRLSPEKIPLFHREGHVCLIPSLAEGLPNVAMEAMATGNLVIATKVGGIPELIKDAVNGLLCNKPDADSLYATMKTAIQHPELIKLLGVEARNTVLTNFSSTDFGKKYAEYYQYLVGNR